MRTIITENITSVNKFITFEWMDDQRSIRMSKVLYNVFITYFNSLHALRVIKVPCSRWCVAQEDFVPVEIAHTTQLFVVRRYWSLVRRLVRPSRGHSWRSSRKTSDDRSTSLPRRDRPSPPNSRWRMRKSRRGSRTDELNGGNLAPCVFTMTNCQ